MTSNFVQSILDDQFGESSPLYLEIDTYKVGPLATTTRTSYHTYLILITHHSDIAEFMDSRCNSSSQLYVLTANNNSSPLNIRVAEGIGILIPGKS